MDWHWIALIAYLAILTLVCLRIIYDTRTTTKTLAYLLLAAFLPVIGMLFYFSFGINYRKRKLYSKKLFDNDELLHRIKQDILATSEKILKQGAPEIQNNKELVRLLLKDNLSPLSADNKVKLLLNGENKFPELLQALRDAKDHIHIEYYIFDDDEIGNQVKDVLIQKAHEGVKVRFIYDHFGSRSIRKKLVPELKAAGVEAFPFFRVIFPILANRINYRNHRKIVVIDGCIGFTGGINISNRYINNGNKDNLVYWRDMHVRIDGPGVYYLQYIFLCDWNFCTEEKITPDATYFCELNEAPDNTLVQIAASGPDSDIPTVLYALLQAINLAQKEILITTPYFIPGDSLLDALIVASLSGVKVKMLTPEKSDLFLVSAAARSYYEDLLSAGIEIYLYEKGFVHSKTLVADGNVSVIGTANMDYRSFELNFEVNAIIYDKAIAAKLQDIFYEDISHARKIDPEQWRRRPPHKQLGDKLARLLSPLL